MFKKLTVIILISFFISPFYSVFAQDNSKPYLNLRIENNVFSPMLKSVKGVIIISEVKNVARIREWTLLIKDEQGKEVKRFSGARKVPDSFVWDALIKKGQPVKDGLYSCEFEISLNAKDVLAVKKSNILIDSVSPFISLSLSEEILFINSGDNAGKNEVMIFLSCGDEGGIDFAKTVLEITDTKNKAVKTYKFEKAIPDFVVWDGCGDDDNPLPEGNYNLIFNVFDIAGNRAQISADISLLDSSGEEQEETGLVQDLKQIIYFDSNKTDLKPQSIKTLQYISEILKENKKNRILITGHTDSTKTEANFKNLSRNRAKAVYDFLIGAGIEADRMKMESFAAKKPLANAKVKNANEQNRRAEITILKTE
ncbi:MAG: OmpA family protein [Endomicrobium sp.]|jgi:outer membrane protein OmpA-like peptidoglycan-associated protein/flagellar hook assembly protein FlgD|nr:OmpA family protein [Endomicrobium sp.]